MPPKPKPCVESEIIAALRASGGSYTGAYGLIVRELGRAWAHGYRCLDNLERRGMTTIERGKRPHATVVRLVGK